MPRVSVVIPLYQTEAYIREALASVLAQTFTDFEVLVIDDGSRDDGPAIARSTGDARVRVVSQDNRGLAGARNSGIGLATGEFVALLDADDTWEPSKLEDHVAQLDADPGLAVSFSASRLVDEAGADVGLVQSPRGSELDAAAFFCRNPIGNGSVPVIRMSALESIAFHDERLGRMCWFDESFRQSEDIECWMRLMVIGGCRFGYVDRPLTRYRVNRGGLSANVGAQLASWRRFRDKVGCYAPEIVKRFGKRAEAYQLRYLARRAVRTSARGQALGLMREAVQLYPAILVEEPGRTFATLAAAIAKGVLPEKAFGGLERRGLRFAQRVPQLRL